MLKNEDLYIGKKVVCLNGKGWAGFEKGGVYTIEEFWDGGISLGGGKPSRGVASEFFEDFEILVDKE